MPMPATTEVIRAFLRSVLMCPASSLLTVLVGWVSGVTGRGVVVGDTVGGGSGVRARPRRHAG